MIRLDSAVVVEGKYDKIRLSNIVDAPIFTTDGFRIFKDKEKTAMLCTVAKKNGIIVLTDSDGAGQIIRNHLRKIIGDEYITNVYLPEIRGKERRKKKPSSAGLLGVEGTADAVIVAALERFAVKKQKSDKKIEKRDFLFWGLAGDGSGEKRERLKAKLSLPQVLSANALLEVVNYLYEYDEFEKIVGEL